MRDQRKPNVIPLADDEKVKSETIKVLLIDDDENHYILTHELLSEVMVGKYAFDWAPSYEEGLKVAARGEHHVCLVDYHLGKRTGVQLIREAREFRLTTPMILLTGLGDYDVDVEAMQAGATDYLVKIETSPERLERTIRYAVQLNTERCRAEEALGSYAKKQAVVAEIGRLALVGGELNDLFAEAVSLVGRTLGVEYCKVLELLPDGDALMLRAGVGWKEQYLVGHSTVSAGKESQAGFTLLSDEPVVVEDLRTETRFSGLPLLHEHGVVSGMSVIIPGRERPYGVLGAHTTSVRRFDTDDVAFLVAVANVLAEAVGRKGAEDEVSQSEARFRRLVDSNMLGVFFFDLSGKITGANDAFLNMVGYTWEDLAGGRMLWTEMTPPKYRNLDERALEELAASGVCETYEKEYIRKDGSSVPILLGCATLEGETQRGVGFVLDIGDRKKAEEALRQSESQSRALFENAMDAVLIVDDRGAYLDVNPAACDLLGVSYDEVIGRTINDFIEKDYRAETSHTWEQFLKEGRMRGVFRLQRPNGEVVEVDFSATANFLPGRHLSVLHDVTEHRKLEDQLRQAQKLESIGQLAAGIAHEINTPTQYVGDNLRFLQEAYQAQTQVMEKYGELFAAAQLGPVSAGLLDDVGRVLKEADLEYVAVEVPKALKQSLEGVEGIARIVQSMKDFAHPDSTEKKAVDLNRAIESTINVARGEWKYVAEMETDFDLSLPPVPCLLGELNQVTLNLIINSSHAIADKMKIEGQGKGVIKISTMQEGDWAVMRISDTGGGIPLANRARLFDPFFTTKEVGKGTGQGLAISHTVVKKHGGTINFETVEGEGTTFIIRLPLYEPGKTPDALKEAA